MGHTDARTTLSYYASAFIEDYAGVSAGVNEWLTSEPLREGPEAS